MTIAGESLHYTLQQAGARGSVMPSHRTSTGYDAHVRWVPSA